MKRTSYSLHRCNSALYGVSVELKDRLHANLLAFADTEPGLVDYCIYSPSFTYDDRTGEKQGCYVISAKFDDRHTEVWASSWDNSPPSDSPLERARRNHAQSLGARYKLFTVKDLATSPMLLKNRQTMQAVLFRGRSFDSTALEMSIAEVLNGTTLTLASLAARLRQPLLLVELAAFRMMRLRRLNADIASRYLSPASEISGGRYA